MADDIYKYDPETDGDKPVVGKSLAAAVTRMKSKLSDVALSGYYDDLENLPLAKNQEGTEYIPSLPIAGYATEDYTDQSIATALSASLKFIDVVNAYAELPDNPANGDVYEVLEAHGGNPAGTEYAWSDEKGDWVALGGYYDLADVAKTGSYDDLEGQPLVRGTRKGDLVFSGMKAIDLTADEQDVLDELASIAEKLITKLEDIDAEPYQDIDDYTPGVSNLKSWISSGSLASVTSASGNPFQMLPRATIARYTLESGEMIYAITVEAYTSQGSVYLRNFNQTYSYDGYKYEYQLTTRDLGSLELASDVDYEIVTTYAPQGEITGYATKDDLSASETSTYNKAMASARELTYGVQNYLEHQMDLSTVEVDQEYNPSTDLRSGNWVKSTSDAVCQAYADDEGDSWIKLGIGTKGQAAFYHILARDIESHGGRICVSGLAYHSSPSIGRMSIEICKLDENGIVKSLVGFGYVPRILDTPSLFRSSISINNTGDSSDRYAISLRPEEIAYTDELYLRNIMVTSGDLAPMGFVEALEASDDESTGYFAETDASVAGSNSEMIYPIALSSWTQSGNTYSKSGFASTYTGKLIQYLRLYDDSVWEDDSNARLTPFGRAVDLSVDAGYLLDATSKRFNPVDIRVSLKTTGNQRTVKISYYFRFSPTTTAALTTTSLVSTSDGSLMSSSAELQSDSVDFLDGLSFAIRISQGYQILPTERIYGYASEQYVSEMLDSANTYADPASDSYLIAANSNASDYNATGYLSINSTGWWTKNDDETIYTSNQSYSTSQHASTISKLFDMFDFDDLDTWGDGVIHRDVLPPEAFRLTHTSYDYEILPSQSYVMCQSSSNEVHLSFDFSVPGYHVWTGGIDVRITLSKNLSTKAIRVTVERVSGTTSMPFLMASYKFAISLTANSLVSIKPLVSYATKREMHQYVTDSLPKDRFFVTIPSSDGTELISKENDGFALNITEDNGYSEPWWTVEDNGRYYNSTDNNPQFSWIETLGEFFRVKEFGTWKLYDNIDNLVPTQYLTIRTPSREILRAYETKFTYNSGDNYTFWFYYTYGDSKIEIRLMRSSGKNRVMITRLLGSENLLDIIDTFTIYVRAGDVLLLDKLAAYPTYGDMQDSINDWVMSNNKFRIVGYGDYTGGTRALNLNAYEGNSSNLSPTYWTVQGNTFKSKDNMDFTWLKSWIKALNLTNTALWHNGIHTEVIPAWFTLSLNGGEASYPNTTYIDKQGEKSFEFSFSNFYIGGIWVDVKLYADESSDSYWMEIRESGGGESIPVTLAGASMSFQTGQQGASVLTNRLDGYMTAAEVKSYVDRKIQELEKNL